MNPFYTKLSKKLSYILRHHPDEYQLVLDEYGWVNLEKLLAAIRAEPTWREVDLGDITAMMEQSPKQRFEMADGKIRALYGHSIQAKVTMEKTEPPEFLYHGTARRFVMI